MESRCKAAEREADARLPQNMGWHCLQLCNGRTWPCRDPVRWWGVETWGSGTPCQQSPLARYVASHRYNGIGIPEGFPEHLWEAEPLEASEQEHKFPSTQK